MRTYMCAHMQPILGCDWIDTNANTSLHRHIHIHADSIPLHLLFFHTHGTHAYWIDGRVVERTCLENKLSDDTQVRILLYPYPKRMSVGMYPFTGTCLYPRTTVCTYGCTDIHEYVRTHVPLYARTDTMYRCTNVPIRYTAVRMYVRTHMRTYVRTDALPSLVLLLSLLFVTR